MPDITSHELITHIRAAVARNDLDDALEMLRTSCMKAAAPNQVADEVAVVSGSLTNLETRTRKGLIDDDSASAERAQLSYQILSLLSCFDETPQHPTAKSSTVEPKGLKAFDSDDKDFYPTLLPPPYRDGLPKSINDLLHDIQELDLESANRVVLLRGPSGCGKTSLVKAGLLPRLRPHVIPVYVEAAAHDTESKIRRKLLAALAPREVDDMASEIAKAAELSTVLDLLADDRFRGRKFVLIIDQFEQWLHAHREEIGDTELARAICKCDGSRVQALLLLRDEYNTAFSRLVAALNLDWKKDVSTHFFDLFDPLHAQNVLAKFGAAYNRLPEDLMLREQFLKQAVEQLVGDDRKVESVKIALFAEMLKDREWTPAELPSRFEAVGVAFLKRWFDPPRGHALLLENRQGAIKILSSLLPEMGSDNIKGGMKSEATLQAAFGPDPRKKFHTILDMLDTELKLITPTEPNDAEQADGEPAEADATAKSYQLTHDYLVPSLRDWLTDRLQSTWHGRALIRLQKLTPAWSRNKEARFLPNLIEYLEIQSACWRRRHQPSLAEADFLWAAWNRHGLWSAVKVLIIAILALGGWIWYSHSLVKWIADPQSSPENLRKLIDNRLRYCRLWANQPLRRLADSNAPKEIQWRAQLALLSKDRSYADPLSKTLVEPITPDEFEIIRDGLNPPPPEILKALWEEFRTRRTFSDSVKEAESKEKKALRAGIALAHYSPSDTDRFQWEDGDYAFLALRLIQEHPVDQEKFRNLLNNKKFDLIQPLTDILLHVDGQPIGFAKRSEERDIGIPCFRDEKPPPNFATISSIADIKDVPDLWRQMASDALCDYVQKSTKEKDFAGVMCQLACRTNPSRFKVFYEQLSKEKLEEFAVDSLVKIASEPPERIKSEMPEHEKRRVQLGQRRAKAAIALIQLNEPEKAMRVFEVAGDPEAQTQFIHNFQDYGLNAEDILALYQLYQRLPDQRDDVRYALLLCLGKCKPDDIRDAVARQDILKDAEKLYLTHGQSAIHGAARWLYSRWKWPNADGDSGENQRRELIAEFANLDSQIESDQKRGGSATKREWFVKTANGVRRTFVCFQPGSFTMGAPVLEERRDRTFDGGVPKLRTIDQPFAICTQEVTKKEIQAYLHSISNDPRYAADKRFAFELSTFSRNPDDAIGYIRWFDAVNYCRWLTYESGLGDSDQCYAPLDERQLNRSSATLNIDDWELVEGAAARRGYRLPREAEWEYACRSGTVTTYGFGSDPTLTVQYGWFRDNRKDLYSKLGSLLIPNLRGLFDMHGNMIEWCQDRWIDQKNHDAYNRRVLRGGGWEDPYSKCRSAQRYRYDTNFQMNGHGFRLVCKPPD